MKKIHITLFLTLCMTSQAMAEKLPIWELGFGGGVLRIPDYRGSDESGTYPYPFIMPIYRGRYFRADEEGIKGILSESDRFRLDLSFYGNVPVNDENKARKGMDELDPIVEVGPMLRYKAWSSPRNRQAVILELPVRAALAIGDGVDAVGYQITPRLSYRRTFDLFERTWKWSVTGGAIWSSEGLNRYFYEVSPTDATLTRPAYRPDAGFAGTRLRTNLYHRDRDKLISLYAVYDNVDGAVFQDSPLVKRDGGLTFGFLVTWFFFQSKEMVDVKQWEWDSP